MHNRSFKKKRFRKKNKKRIKSRKIRGGNKRKSKEVATPTRTGCPPAKVKLCMKPGFNDISCKKPACQEKIKELKNELGKQLEPRSTTPPPAIPSKKIEKKISESKNKKLEKKISESKNKKCSTLNVKSGECKTMPGCRPQNSKEWKKYKKENNINPKSKNKKCINDETYKIPESTPQPIVEPIVEPIKEPIPEPQPIAEPNPEQQLAESVYDVSITHNGCRLMKIKSGTTYWELPDNTISFTEPSSELAIRKIADNELDYWYNSKNETVWDNASKEEKEVVCGKDEDYADEFEKKCKSDFCPEGHEGKWNRKNCYLKPSRKHHPDKGGDKETFQRLKECHEKLSKAKEHVKNAEEDVVTATEEVKDAIEDKKESELLLEDAKKKEASAKQEILQLEDKTSEPTPEPQLNIPVNKSCVSKNDCGEDFCLTPINGGEGKCVPKTEYISNMKARKQPKQVEEGSLEGVGEMFSEPEPSVTPTPSPEPNPQPETCTNIVINSNPLLDPYLKNFTRKMNPLYEK